MIVLFTYQKAINRDEICNYSSTVIDWQSDLSINLTLGFQLKGQQLVDLLLTPFKNQFIEN